MTTRELNLVILPNGTLHLEWIDTQDAVTKGSAMLQKEIFDRYSDNSDVWLFFLGYSDLQIPLPLLWITGDVFPDCFPESYAGPRIWKSCASG